jgi:hypothetical protein
MRIRGGATLDTRQVSDVRGRRAGGLALVRWFSREFPTGKPAACDTFSGSI